MALKHRLLDLLACPLDGGALELVEWETRGDRDVWTGLLLNGRRRLAYPILRGIPRLLTFRSRITTEFLTAHGARLRDEHPGFELAAEAPKPGEESVLETFSAEWEGYGWDGRSYWNLTAEGTFRAMEAMLDLHRNPIAGKVVLEAGMGIGAFSDWLARAHGAEVVGVDLSQAVEVAAATFVTNPLFHPVQASVFAPPFRRRAFDLLFSHGVLHHTFSPGLAFARLACLVRPGGRAYVWVYAPADERRSVMRRLQMVVERVIRPVLSRLPVRLQTVALLPIVPMYILHQNVLSRGREQEQVDYGVREALHAARDRLTPRFASRHDEIEVVRWFREAGFVDIVPGSVRELPDWLPASFASCTSVMGTSS